MRDGGCIPGREGTRELIVTKIHRPRCESGGLRYNGNLWRKAGGAFFRFSHPPCTDFRTFLSAINFGAPLADLARLPSFSNFKLVCPLCPPCLQLALAKKRFAYKFNSYVVSTERETKNLHSELSHRFHSRARST